jgi:RND family efflux transporter MFP subunit
MHAHNPCAPSQIALAMGLSALMLVAGCKPNAPAASPSGPLPVQTSILKPETVRDTLALDGTVQPVQQAQLTARVPGVLQAIHFEDGASVRKGQLLFSIERNSYVEQVRLNEARLVQAQAEFDRQGVLMRDNATAQASVDAAQSNLQQAQANLRLAQINLEYTEVRAPFDGVMGRRAVDVGNLVGATGPTTLGTLLQISPAYVAAAVGEREALRLRANDVIGNANARAGPKRLVGVAASATLQGQDTPADTGHVDFIDHVANATTGSVAIRARFENRERRLLPGFYARLVVDLGSERQALVLKKSWLLSDQEGSYVMTVEADGRARRVNLKAGALGHDRVEVLEGLKGGEVVIVEGHTRAKPGQLVRPEAQRQAAGNTR